MSRPQPRPDSVRRRTSHSSAVADVRGQVRFRAAHLLVAVRLGEWRDDALACLPAGAGSGGPTVPTRRGWVAGATEHEPSGAPSRHTPGRRLSAVGGESDAAGAGAELRGETSPLLTALMTTESAISGRSSFLSGCRCGRPRTPVRSGRVDPVSYTHLR